MFLWTKYRRRCESQWFSNTGNFPLAIVKGLIQISYPGWTCQWERSPSSQLSETELTVLLPTGGWWLGKRLQPGCLMGSGWRWLVSSLLSSQEQSHRPLEGKNGSRPRSSASSPSFTYHPWDLKNSLASCLQRSWAPHPSKAKNPEPWAGSPTGWA